MPVHDLGYRTHEGRRTPLAWRWSVIAETGVRLAWQTRWLRRMVLLAYMPMLYFGVGFLAYELLTKYALEGGQGVEWAEEFYRDGLPLPRELVEKISEDPAGARPDVWRYLLLIFFRSPQAVLMVLVIGLIAPTLIAHDLRSRAFILYFSRPLTRIEYLLGKAAILWTYGLAITTIPALILYLVAIFLSPTFSVFWTTWDLPFRILLATAILMVPTTAIALMMSSLTTESRYASFAWFALWILGWVAYSAMRASASQSSYRSGPRVALEEHSWHLVSLFHTLGRVQDWVFGLEVPFEKVLPALVLLGLVTVVSVSVLFRRVSSPMRV